MYRIKNFFVALWRISNNTITNYQRDKVSGIGAALAYYTIFSLPAVIIIMVGLIGFFYGQAATEGRIYAELHTIIGSETAEQIQKAVQYIGSPSEGRWATILGFAFLLYVSTTIFFTIQEALNRVFAVTAPVPPKLNILWTVINRLISFGMILLICILFVAAILLNTLIAQLAHFIHGNEIIVMSYLPDVLARWVPFLAGYLMFFIRIISSIFTLSLFFYCVYTILPAVKIGWRYAWSGALFSGVFFWLGQELMSFYLSRVSAVSAYGAAGSLIVLLVWVYYSAQLVFIGAEFIKALCLYRGVSILPKSFAQRLHKSSPAKTDENQTNATNSSDSSDTTETKQSTTT